MDVTMTVSTILLSIFYALVISAIMITFWKIHVVTNDLYEIKTLLRSLKAAVDDLKSAT